MARASILAVALLLAVAAGVVASLFKIIIWIAELGQHG